MQFKMAHILIATTSFTSENDGLIENLRQQHKVTINPHGRKLTETEIVDLGKEADGIIAGTEGYSQSVLSRLKKLKVISRCGVGMDSIDLNEAAKLNIKVFNTPDAPTNAVAELTVGLILSLLRFIPLSAGEMKNSVWKKHMGNLLSKKNIGIIGYGRIGKRVAELLSPFDVTISYYDTAINEASSIASFKSMNEILAWADVLSLHCSPTASSEPLLGPKEFGKLKKGSWFINTSRGTLVDEKSLIDAIETGRLAGVALDVFQREPYTGPLTSFKNVILLPHIGSYAKESRVDMERESVRNLLRGLNF